MSKSKLKAKNRKQTNGYSRKKAEIKASDIVEATLQHYIAQAFVLRSRPVRPATRSIATRSLSSRAASPGNQRRLSSRRKAGDSITRS